MIAQGFPSSSGKLKSYLDVGIDPNKAVEAALQVPISMHCWQADDVTGLESGGSAADSGGIKSTGNFPGKARNGDEMRMDFEKVLSLVPGIHRVNIHAFYAEPGKKKVDRDAMDLSHFQNWVDWAKSRKIALDFNPTYFAHSKAADGFTLSSSDEEVRKFWVKHGIASRKIAAAMGKAQGGVCVNNHWVPDGLKDLPGDRWSPRARLAKSYDEIFAAKIPDEKLCLDAVEPKLFGIGSEEYVAGSMEFYSSYALSRKKLLCLDMGHFHPTEGIADKISALLQFHEGLLLHTSRPIRWDSDHVVLFDDATRAVFHEVGAGQAWNRVKVALDYFDASINRIAAYVIGIRATRKAILYSLLTPHRELAQLQREGKGAQRLALMERLKVMPFGEAWEECCKRAGVPGEAQWIKDAESYEKKVLAKRG